jgi:hypothetical protein
VADLVENEEEQYLFLAAHHLSVDLVSWRILLQDLEDLILHRVETLPRYVNTGYLFLIPPCLIRECSELP